MNTEKEIRNIENRMVRSYFEDGIVEILLGLIGLWTWINTLFNFESRIVEFLVLILPIAFTRQYIEFIKKKHIYPRKGYSDQQKYGKRQVNQAILMGVLGLGLIMSVVFILETRSLPFSAFFHKYLFLILGIMAASYLWLVGYLSTVKRLSLYAVLAGLIFLLRYFIPFGETVYLIYFSCLPLAMGVILFARFLRKYPKVEVVEE